MYLYEHDDTIMAITLELSNDKRVIDRSIFTVLDLLAALGGLQSILASLAASAVSIWTGGSLLDAYLIRELFKSKQVPVIV